MLSPEALYQHMRRQTFVIAGPNVIESEDHVLRMAAAIKAVTDRFDVIFIFKASFDKANRTSAESYRGVSLAEAQRIFTRVRTELNVPVITDVHEPHQCAALADCVDVLQIPAFLCRQSDLIVAAARTGLVLHIKKGQFCHADALHKTVQKAAAAGNELCVLCERGSFFGYQDLVVDPRNLIRLRGEKNLVSMDITHCLQQPAQKSADGVVKSGGERHLIPAMGKMAMALDVHGIFLETHDRPDESRCDAPTQWPLHQLEWLLKHIGCTRKGPEIPTSFASSQVIGCPRKEPETIIVPGFERLVASKAFGEMCTRLSRAADASSLCTVYFSGVGKSRVVAMHAADLLKSVGLRSHLLDPLQAGHGDVGPVRACDVVVLFSKSGRTVELLKLARLLLQPRGCFVYGVCCQQDSEFERILDTTLVLPFHGETDGPNKHIPTNSVVTQILLVNTLASRLAANCSLDEYARNHPEGAIGKELSAKLHSKL